MYGICGSNVVCYVGCILQLKDAKLSVSHSLKGSVMLWGLPSENTFFLKHSLPGKLEIEQAISKHPVDTSPPIRLDDKTTKKNGSLKRNRTNSAVQKAVFVWHASQVLHCMLNNWHCIILTSTTDSCTLWTIWSLFSLRVELTADVCRAWVTHLLREHNLLLRRGGQPPIPLEGEELAARREALRRRNRGSRQRAREAGGPIGLTVTLRSLICWTIRFSWKMKIGSWRSTISVFCYRKIWRRCLVIRWRAAPQRLGWWYPETAVPDNINGSRAQSTTRIHYRHIWLGMTKIAYSIIWHSPELFRYVFFDLVLASYSNWLYVWLWQSASIRR